MAQQSGLLGRIAVRRRFITMDQLAQATTEQGRPGNTRRLGEILVDLGLLSEDQLKTCLEVQRAVTAQMQEWSAGEDGRSSAPVSSSAAPVAPDPFAALARAAASAMQQARPIPPVAEVMLDLDEPPVILGSDEAPALEPSSPPLRQPSAASSSPAAPAPPAPAAARPVPAQQQLDGVDATAEQPPAASGASPASAPAAPRAALDRRPHLRSGALDTILAAAARAGASDVHLHPNCAIKLRINGALTDHGQALEPAWLTQTLRAALTPTQLELLDAHGQLDLAYTVDEVGRFRCNLYRSQNGHDGVFRCIPLQPPRLEELGLPGDLARLTTFHQGLVLITGPAGCGKSSTMAALLDIINEERTDHILTIEDPVETLYPPRRAQVNQRQVQRHTESFARALRAALREDPDVIAIGELRDLETISLALTAAETGHLVLSTLHTSNAARTITRLIGAFPPEEQSQIRTMVSESLRAVVSQRLLPTADGKRRVAAIELLRVTRAVGNLIRDNRTVQLRSAMQMGQATGMCLLEHSLARLVKAGVVTREVALQHCEDPRLLDG
ncbi:MAG: PilT/PilU family type 4a pilus ATPase [Pseudomonadota bacterium]